MMGHVSARGRKRRRALSLRGYRRTCFAATIAIGLLVGAVAMLGVVGTDNPSTLPPTLRLSVNKLSELPVEIGDVFSCGCWGGPRGQAQRKFKFRVVNGTSQDLSIGGGEQSSIRLLVAYRDSFEPVQTVPDPDSVEYQVRAESPGDVALDYATNHLLQVPTEINDREGAFGVPEGFRLWALAPNQHLLTESLREEPMALNEGSITFPTNVARPSLLPGEGYWSDNPGHGVWTFYIPLPPEMEGIAVPGVFENIISPSAHDDYLIVIGVAALGSGEDGVVRLLGFAAAPSTATFMNPVYL